MHPTHIAGLSLERIDENRVVVLNRHDIPITLFAREDVPIEAAAFRELSAVLSIQDTLHTLSRAQATGIIPTFLGDDGASIRQVALTPDFHKGSGIPVGTVLETQGFLLPSAVGNDICCGMRLLATDVHRDEILAHADELMKRLRSLFFEGKRDIPMSPLQREALLREGLTGLYNTHRRSEKTGAWVDYDDQTQLSDLSRTHLNGSLPTSGLFGFESFVRSSGQLDGRDPQIGSIGGGNHFVEIQSVEETSDGSTAYAWGAKKDHVTIMVHSGSVGLGHSVGGYFVDAARQLFPMAMRNPSHGFFPLPTSGPHEKLATAYLDAMHNAANFAFGNRLFLGLMVVRALRETLGRPVESRLIYDAPHNLIWSQSQRHRFLHRKGATPALGAACDSTDNSYLGQPVIVPGSMGASSYLMAGLGNEQALCSACHGAGRGLTRGQASHVDDEVYRNEVGKLRVVTPIDPDSPQIRARRDILAKYHARLKEEAPYAYKPISPVIDTIEKSGIARKVIRVFPLMTIKG